MGKEKELGYESPMIEIYEVMVENGFESSSVGMEGFDGVEEL